MAASERERTYGQWWGWEGDTETVGVADLRAACDAVFAHVGVAPDDAALLTVSMLDKTVQGDFARGIVLLPAMVRSLQEGTLSRTSDVRIVRERGATAVVEAGDGVPPGPDDLVCHGAMRLAVERARQFGVGLVAARAGARILTPIVRRAAEAGMVGVTFTQSTPAVAPLGGMRALFGNAPTAIAIPAGAHDPIIVDMSLTNTSTSGVLLTGRQHRQVPPGFILDRDGQPTTDPRAVFDGDLDTTTGHLPFVGSVLPLGGGHKGYALVYAIGLLASLLSDTSPSWELVAEEVAGAWGSVHMAIDVDALNPNDPAGHVDRFVDHVADQPRRAGVDEILYPGQGSQRLRRDREAAGTVDVPAPQLAALRQVAVDLGIAIAL